MRNLPRIVGPMLAVLLAISLQSPASAIPDQIPPEPRPDPSVTLARNAWATLGNRIEAGAAYAQAVDQSMACPVPGSTFVSSFGAPRTGHLHQGVDMMAPHGTVVLSPASGLFEGDGESFYVYADDGTMYFGTHNGGDLVASGSRVVRGQPISRVSNTGNAAGGSPHLHFEIHPGGGPAVDPYRATLEACATPVTSAPVVTESAAAVTTPTFVYGVMEIHRWANATYGRITPATARTLTRFLNTVVGNRLAAYIAAVSRPDCSGPADCPALIRAAFARQGIAWRGGEAVAVATCESGLNPSARGGGGGNYAGLFQQSLSYWPGRAASYGFAGASPYDPWANAMVSAGMVRDTGGWSHWACG